jgi:threonine/homoserine/homoserine lactone efflux protein
MSSRLAGWVLGTAVVVILVPFIGALIGGLDKSSDVAAVVVAVVSAIGTVVVAFFGIHVAESGRRAAEDGRVRSEQLRFYEQGRVTRLAREEDPHKRAEILNEQPPDPYSV